MSGVANLIPGKKVYYEHRDLHDDLKSLDVDEFLIWVLEPGEKFGSGHSIRNTMRNCAEHAKMKFRTIQHKEKVYVVRVE